MYYKVYLNVLNVYYIKYKGIFIFFIKYIWFMIWISLILNILFYSLFYLFIYLNILNFFCVLYILLDFWYIEFYIRKIVIYFMLYVVY